MNSRYDEPLPDEDTGENGSSEEEYLQAGEDKPEELNPDSVGENIINHKLKGTIVLEEKDLAEPGNGSAKLTDASQPVTPAKTARSVDARKIASLRRNKHSKTGKLERLSAELDEHRGILNRGYIIIPGSQDPQSGEGRKHKQLDVTDRMFHADKKLALESELFDLKIELGNLETELKEKFSRNKLAGKQKLQKKKEEQKLEKATVTLKGVMEEESKNGGASKLTEINKLIIDGNKNEALQSLMSFLKEKVKGPFRKIDTDEEFASKVSAELIEFLPRLIPS